MISLVLIAIASICNSIMDIVRDKYEVSVFNNPNFNRRYWDAKISWQNKWHGGNRGLGEKFLFSSSALVWTTDAWHFFKSGMVSCLCLSIIMYEPIITLEIFENGTYSQNINTFISRFLDLLFLGATWNTTFRIFYHHIFLK
jgi:hypothetical protein